MPSPLCLPSDLLDSLSASLLSLCSSPTVWLGLLESAHQSLPLVVFRARVSLVCSVCL